MPANVLSTGCVALHMQQMQHMQHIRHVLANAVYKHKSAYAACASIHWYMLAYAAHATYGVYTACATSVTQMPAEAPYETDASISKI